MNPDSSVKQTGSCEHVIITTADGRVFDLGPPESRLFSLRRRLYLHKRRHELKEITHG